MKGQPMHKVTQGLIDNQAKRLKKWPTFQECFQTNDIIFLAILMGLVQSLGKINLSIWMIGPIVVFIMKLRGLRRRKWIWMVGRTNVFVMEQLLSPAMMIGPTTNLSWNNYWYWAQVGWLVEPPYPSRYNYQAQEWEVLCYWLWNKPAEDGKFAKDINMGLMFSS